MRKTPHNLSYALLQAVLSVGLLCICGPLFAVPPAAVRAIEVEPTSVRLYPDGWKQQLIVTAVTQQGREIDRTHESAFASSDPAVAAVSANGVVSSKKSGQARITVRAEDREETIEIIVRDDARPPVQFVNDIVPILTKHSCNSGGCHGKATGQNGFRLSLLGFEPEFDYRSLVKDAFGRRTVSGSVERSLLLSKATNKMPHGGGQRLDENSDDYQVLREWVVRNLPEPGANDPLLEKIAVFPKRRILTQSTQQQLLVTAHFSDGETRDVTRQALYLANEKEIAETTESGLVTTKESGGLFTVMVRFGGKIAVFHGTVPFDRVDAATAQNHAEQLVKLENAHSQSRIDRQLFAQWKRLGILPSPQVDDYRFIRRASLAICGTPPTVDEAKTYAADTSPDKRARLIDRLLERPEYASFFGLKWADILQNRGTAYGAGKQRRGTSLFAAWIKDSIAQNKPYHQFFGEILTATGSQRTNPATLWYRQIRTTKDYVESISQAFLGVRVQCAQCHHHPFERWSQGDYYSLAAIFARVGRKGGFSDGEVPTDETIYVKNVGEIVHPRTGEVMDPRPLGGETFALNRYDDPRRALVKWMADPVNPFVAQTMANRMWGHFFGRGVIHPIDDARSTNPPSNPELLDALSQEFIESGFDMKHLIRVICNSYAFRLSGEPTPANRSDVQSYARFHPQRLSAEVLLDSISQVIGVPTEFSGGKGMFPEGTRAIDLPDENVPVTFLNAFGRPARTSACECERKNAPSLQQALELVNSQEIQRKLQAENNFVATIAASELSVTERAQEIFLRVLARLPRADELQTSVKFLETSADDQDSTEAYRSLVWSLLATNEFMFNL